MAENSEMRREPQRVNEVNVSNLESKLYDLTNLVKPFVIGKKQVKVCGVCKKVGQPIGAFLKLQEDVVVAPNDVKAVGGFQGQQPLFYNNNFEA